MCKLHKLYKLWPIEAMLFLYGIFHANLILYTLHLLMPLHSYIICLISEEGGLLGQQGFWWDKLFIVKNWTKPYQWYKKIFLKF